MKSEPPSVIAARNDIKSAFQLLLGRNPSPPGVVDQAVGKPLATTLRRLLLSPEFEHKVLEAMVLGRALPHERFNGGVAAELISWASGTLGITEEAKVYLAQGRSWAEVVPRVLADPGFQQVVLSCGDAKGAAKEVLRRVDARAEKAKLPGSRPSDDAADSAGSADSAGGVDSVVVERLFLLLLRRRPGDKTIAAKVSDGGSVEMLIAELMRSSEFIERLVPRFLDGALGGEEHKSPLLQKDIEPILELVTPGASRAQVELRSWSSLFLYALSAPDSRVAKAFEALSPKSEKQANIVRRLRTGVELMAAADSLLRRGDVASAYLVTARLVAQGFGCAAPRNAVLDLAVRTDGGAGHSAFLSRLRPWVDQALLESVAQAGRFRRGAASAPEGLAAAVAACLPKPYANLAAMCTAPERGRTGWETMDRFLTWSMLTRLTQCGADLDVTDLVGGAGARSGALAFCYVLEGCTSIEPMALDYLRQLSRVASVYVLTAEETVTRQLRDAHGVRCMTPARFCEDVLSSEGSEDIVYVCSRGIRFFCTSMVGWIPKLIGPARAAVVSVARTSSRQGAGIVPELGGLLMEHEANAVALRSAYDARNWVLISNAEQGRAWRNTLGKSAPVSIPGVRIEDDPPAAIAASCVVVADASKTLETIAVPFQAFVYSIEAGELRSPDGRVERVEVTDLVQWFEARGYKDLPAIPLSGRIRYPADYVSASLAGYERHGARISVCTVSVAWAGETHSFDIGSAGRPGLAHLAWLAASVVPVAEMVRRMNEAGATDPAEVVIASSVPWLVLPNADMVRGGECGIPDDFAREWASSGGKCGVAARSLWLHASSQWDLDGLNSNTQRLREVELREHHAWIEELRAFVEADADAATPSLAEVVDARKLDTLVHQGHEHLVRQVLLKIASTPGDLERLSAAEFGVALDWFWRFGVQQECARLMYLRVPALCIAQPNLVVPLFELIAVSLDEVAIAAAALAAAVRCLSSNQARSIYRINEVIRRFCDHHVMLQFLAMVDQSQHSQVLDDRSFCATAGAALLPFEPIPFALANTGYTWQHFVKQAPSDALLMRAIQDRDRPRVESVLRRHLVAEDPVWRLFDRLRAYTADLASLNIDASRWPYYIYGTHRERVVLATLINDVGYLKSHIDERALLRPDDIALAATYLGEFEPLERVYAEWARRCDVAPLAFRGGSLRELFQSVAEQKVPRSHQFESRVSVITTVLNPDLGLLRLALESALNQTHRNLEVLLVDDGSSEEVRHELRQLSGIDERIRYVELARNVGTYGARNAALKVATGEFIAIQDGDDVAHPSKLERQLAEFHRVSGLKLCTTPHLRFDRLGRLQYEANFELLGDGMATSMYRRTVFDEVGPFLPVRSRGDVEFRTRLKQAYGADAHLDLPCPMLFCLSSPTNLSNRVHKEYLKLFRAAFTRRFRRPLGIGGKSPEGGAEGELVVPWPLRSQLSP